MMMYDAATRVAKRGRSAAVAAALACRPRRGAGLLLVAAALAACDFPTALPRFEPRFVMPIDSTTIRVNELLPAGVSATDTTFVLSLAPVDVQKSLADMCGSPCQLLHGRVAPKPAFSYSFATPLALPADIHGGVLSSGSVQVTASHSFAFDPLRPPGSLRNGTLTIVVRSGGRQVGTAVIDQPFPRHTPVARTISITPGNLNGEIDVQLILDSPAGDPVMINTAEAVHVTARPGALHVTEIRAAVRQRTIAMQPLDVDLSGVDDDIRSRARGGSLILQMRNPFNVSGELQLKLYSPPSGADYQYPVVIAPGETTQRIELTQYEMFRVLGFNVNVSLAGPVSGDGATMTLRPGQVISLSSRLELILEIGS
jgi:hypothetical protein